MLVRVIIETPEGLKFEREMEARSRKAAAMAFLVELLMDGKIEGEAGLCHVTVTDCEPYDPVTEAVRVLKGSDIQ